MRAALFGSSDHDEVFRALAEPVRREMLDHLRASPGVNVAELTEALGQSRYAVMRHLRTLEEASLVASRKVGRERRLYVNGAPLQAIYDRWMSRHAGVLADFVGSLQRRVQESEGERPAPAGEYRHRLVEYIRTTPDRLWQALTDPRETVLYFHGLEVESGFEVGTPIRYLRTGEDGRKTVDVDGVVFDVEPGRHLSHTFRFPARPEPATRALYRIDPLGECVRLTVDHEGFQGETPTYQITAAGWPAILSGLKTYLETGSPLHIPMSS